MELVREPNDRRDGPAIDDVLNQLKEILISYRPVIRKMAQKMEITHESRALEAMKVRLSLD